MTSAERRALSRIAKSRNAAAELRTFLKARPQSRRIQIDPRKLARKEAHALDTQTIRAVVAARADGHCEACLVYDPIFSLASALNPLELDHWLGGSGRKRQAQAVENTWALHRSCHRARQANDPSAAVWNERFAAHCGRHGYPVLRHIEHARLP